MKISKEGIQLIANFEGKRYSAYKDVAGFATIGIGHLIKPGEKFPVKMTEEEVISLFRKDIANFETAVNKAVKVPLSQNQFDALVSFTFNCGIGALQTSTLLKLLNQGKYIDAANQLLRWDKAGGKVCTGLSLRRQKERLLFLKK